MEPGATGGRTLGAIVDAGCGVALLAGAFAPWLRSGQGHTLRGLDLADQLLSGRLSPSWGRSVGFALYACVAVGALLIASSAARGRRPDAFRLAVTATMLIATGVVVALNWFPLGLWGPAPVLAVFGLAVSCVANSWRIVHGRHLPDEMPTEE